MSFSGVFPPTSGEGFTDKQDARFYGVQIAENVIKNDTDGGYEFTRPRSTRKPRKTFRTGFTRITQSNYETLLDFYDRFQQFGSFTWTDPTDSKVYSVRFVKPPTISYQGVGPLREYDIEFELKQV